MSLLDALVRFLLGTMYIETLLISYTLVRVILRHHGN